VLPGVIAGQRAFTCRAVCALAPVAPGRRRRPCSTGGLGTEAAAAVKRALDGAATPLAVDCGGPRPSLGGPAGNAAGSP
jgi:hypothetical protein